MGIRTPVVGVRVPHDWPDYTIAANCFTKCALWLLKPVDMSHSWLKACQENRGIMIRQEVQIHLTHNYISHLLPLI